MPARPRFVRDTWELIKPYWSSEERYSAWLLLAAVIGLTLAMVYMNVQFNSWYNEFYNALQEKNKEEFFRLMIRFGILAAIYIAMAVYAFYLNQMLQIRWRRWMTDVYLQHWLAERTYYRMQLTGAVADNPDQRIAEDFKLFVDETLSLSLGFLNAVVTLGSFVGILWGLSGPLAIPLQRRRDRHPGLHGMGRAGLCDRRHLADSQDRQVADRAQLQPAALRGRLPLRAGALPRKHRRRGAVRRRTGRTEQFPRALRQRSQQLVAHHEAPEDPQLLSPSATTRWR